MAYFSAKSPWRGSAHLPVWLTLIGCALWMTSPAAGQINTGKIVGTVIDSVGAAIATATVRARNEATDVVTAAHTQDNGDYSINFLIPGQYTVEVEAQGFGNTSRKRTGRNRWPIRSFECHHASWRGPPIG